MTRTGRLALTAALVAITGAVLVAPAESAAASNPRVPAGASGVIALDAAPVVTSLSATSGPTHGKHPIAIHGKNFGTDPVVHFGTEVSPSVSVRGNTIKAVVPAGHGIVDVTVTTTAGTSATSPADQYSYIEITDFTPKSGPVAGGQQVTITGTGFQGTLAVRFNTSSAMFTLVSPTMIIATTPAVAEPGTAEITVVTQNGGTPTGPQYRYQYV